MKTQRGLIKWLTTGVILMAAAVFVTACGNKNDGGGTVVATGPITPSCVGCPAGVTLLSSAVGKSFSGGALESELALQFYGDSSILGQQIASGGTSLPTYYGSVVATGTLRVRVARTYGCNIPAGDYTITTTAPGTWNNQSFWNLQMTATGPTTLQITLQNNAVFGAVPAIVDLAGAQYPFKLVSMNPPAQVNSLAGGICQYPYNTFNYSYY